MLPCCCRVTSPFVTSFVTNFVTPFVTCFVTCFVTLFVTLFVTSFVTSFVTCLVVCGLAQVVKAKMDVRVPADAFPDDQPPAEGYWTGKTCNTKKGGAGDIGIKIPGEDIFTVPKEKAASWMIW